MRRVVAQGEEAGFAINVRRVEMSRDVEIGDHGLADDSQVVVDGGEVNTSGASRDRR